MDIEAKKLPGIYAIINHANNKRYIGQATNLYKRLDGHITALRNNKSKHKHLQNSFNKYGEENFECTVLEYCSIEELDERECYYMALYDVENPEHGYNKKNGGQHGGSKYTEESRKKMSDSQKKLYQDNPELRHRQLSEQFKKAWANQQYHDSRVGENHPFYGKHHTEEARRKISESNKGKCGHPISEEQKKLISEINKGREPMRKDKTPVYCIELDKYYSNATDAVRELKLKKNHISDVCKGKRQTSGGYHWRYLTDEELLIWENKVS